MDILACEPIGNGNEHQVKGSPCCLVAQPIQSGTLQTGGTFAIITKNLHFLPRPSLLLTMPLESLQLLLDGLCLHLTMPDTRTETAILI